MCKSKIDLKILNLQTSKKSELLRPKVRKLGMNMLENTSVRILYCHEQAEVLVVTSLRFVAECVVDWSVVTAKNSWDLKPRNTNAS